MQPPGLLEINRLSFSDGLSGLASYAMLEMG